MIAVIGCGNWGKNLVRTFYELLGPDRVLVYDEDANRPKILITQYPGLVFVDSLERIWADDAIDAVVIATPPQTHFTLARKALEKGKHVFVEKPLATRVPDAVELCELAQRKRRVLMVDHLLLFHPAVQEVARIVARGELGTLRYLYSQRLNLGIVRSEENVMWSLGAHDVAVALHLFGVLPDWVVAHGGVYLQRDRGIQDVVFVTLTFRDEQIANFHLSWLDPEKTRRITIVGSEKMIVFDDMDPRAKLKIHDKGAVVVPEDRTPQVRYGEIMVPSVSLKEPLAVACEHFLACLAGESPVHSSGVLGLDVVRVLEAAQASLDQGGVMIALSERN